MIFNKKTLYLTGFLPISAIRAQNWIKFTFSITIRMLLEVLQLILLVLAPIYYARSSWSDVAKAMSDFCLPSEALAKEGRRTIGDPYQESNKTFNFTFSITIRMLLEVLRLILLVSFFSYLLFAFQEACVYAKYRHHSIWPLHLYVKELRVPWQ